MYSLLLLASSFSLYAFVNAGGSSPAIVTQNYLLIANFNDCEGKNAGNYTLVGTFQSDQTCSVLSPEFFIALVQSTGDHQKAVNSLQPLAGSAYPAGAYIQYESLYLITSGPLQGKYAYEKSIALVVSYLKKCSSILGYSYITAKSAVLLISDKLDLNVLLSPTGAFDAFKKECTTVCNGVEIFV